MGIDQLSQVTRNSEWKKFALSLLSGPAPSPSFVEEFAVQWIVAGHHVRDQLSDDRLLVRLLRFVLPPYEGSALTLWRGENRDRWDSRQTGFAWTSDREIARMFGRGLNAVRSGGLLLEGHFELDALISGPHAYSGHLGEKQFTADPQYARSIEVLEEFPCSS